MDGSLNWLEMPWESCRCGQGLYVLSGRGAAPPCSHPSAGGGGEPSPCLPTPWFFGPPAQKHGDSRAHGAAVPTTHRAHGAASPVSRGPGAMRGHSRRYGATSLKACSSGAR